MAISLILEKSRPILCQWRLKPKSRGAITFSAQRRFVFKRRRVVVKKTVSWSLRWSADRDL